MIMLARRQGLCRMWALWPRMGSLLGWGVCCWGRVRGLWLWIGARGCSSRSSRPYGGLLAWGG